MASRILPTTDVFWGNFSGSWKVTIDEASAVIAFRRPTDLSAYLGMAYVRIRGVGVIFAEDDVLWEVVSIDWEDKEIVARRVSSGDHEFAVRFPNNAEPCRPIFTSL